MNKYREIESVQMQPLKILDRWSHKLARVSQPLVQFIFFKEE